MNYKSIRWSEAFLITQFIGIRDLKGFDLLKGSQSRIVVGARLRVNFR